jgi:hypothetical protein
LSYVSPGEPYRFISIEIIEQLRKAYKRIRLLTATSVPMVPLPPLVVIPDDAGSIDKAEIKAVLKEMDTARDGPGKPPHNDLGNRAINCPFLF